MEILQWSDQVDLVNTFMQMTPIQLTTEDLAKIDSSLQYKYSLTMAMGQDNSNERVLYPI